MMATAPAFTRPAFLDGPPKGLFIDGRALPAASGKTFRTHNPSTGEVLAAVADGDARDVNLAVAAARRAFEGPWRRFTPFDRQQVMLRLADLVDRHYDELAMLDSLDMGGPISRTVLGRRRAVALLRYYAGLATATHGETIDNSVAGDVFSYTLKEPVGVVGAINPWNGPIGLAIWKLGPVLATACTLVLKPAEQAPLSPLRLAELAMEAGLPAGVFNVVSGMGAAGAALADHPGVDKIAFTGSTEVGQKIIRASAGNAKRVSLELGGRAPRWRCSPTRGRSAAPARGFACSARSTTSSSSASPRSRRRCAWATRSIPKRSWGRSSRPRSSTA